MGSNMGTLDESGGTSDMLGKLLKLQSVPDADMEWFSETCLSIIALLH